MERDRARDECGNLPTDLNCPLIELRIVGDHEPMATEDKDRRPGDLFLDRYMPQASKAEREEAYENLRSLIVLLVQIDERLSKKGCEQPDSRAT